MYNTGPESIRYLWAYCPTYNSLCLLLDAHCSIWKMLFILVYKNAKKNSFRCICWSIFFSPRNDPEIILFKHHWMTTKKIEAHKILFYFHHSLFSMLGVYFVESEQAKGTHGVQLEFITKQMRGSFTRFFISETKYLWARHLALCHMRRIFGIFLMWPPPG